MKFEDRKFFYDLRKKREEGKKNTEKFLSDLDENMARFLDKFWRYKDPDELTKKLFRDFIQLTAMIEADSKLPNENFSYDKIKNVLSKYWEDLKIQIQEKKILAI